MKKLAFILFVFLSQVDIFIFVFALTADYDGGVGFIGLFLFFFILCYFVFLTIWSYRLYKSKSSNKVQSNLHILTVLILGLIIPLYFVASSKFLFQKSSKDSGVLNIPFDTNEVISSMTFKDSLNLLNSFSKDNRNNLKIKLDTIDLIFMAYACDCPDWLNFNEYKKTHYPNTNINSYYIEAADSSLIIDQRLFVSGNIVRFIGREYKELCYPDNARFIDPNPPKGKVFRYYSYKLLRPYRVWGPEILDSVDELTGDTISFSTQLTIK